ncbi:MAG: hypothetical protein VB913_00975 [Rhodospirillales bacterium]
MKFLKNVIFQLGRNIKAQLASASALSMFGKSLQVLLSPELGKHKCASELM